MNKHALIIFSLIAALAACAGCAKKPGPDDAVLARVGNKTITANDLKARVAKMPVYYQKIVSKDPKRYIEDVIVEMMCYEEGIRKGLDRDREVKEVIGEAKKKIVIAKLIKNEVENKIVVTEEEMRGYYDEHKEEFKTPEMWRASHILVSDQNEAAMILDELSKGGSFEELAKARSIDATATRGGDVGFFRAGQLVPDFEQACLKLNIGQTSGIVATQFGYHIIRLTDKKEPGIKTFEEMRPAIEAELKKEKRGEMFKSFVMELKNKYGVDVKEDEAGKPA